MKKLFWNEYISIGAMVIGIASLILSMVVPGPQGPAGLPGSNGVNGSNGTNGVDGSDGVNGSNGVDGSNGIDGQDGADGESVEFKVIDGLMMYRIGDNGDWQYYQTDGSKDYRFGLENQLVFETDFLLDFKGLNTMIERDIDIMFDDVTLDDQSDYVNARLDEGYIPIATPEDFLAINEDLSESYVLVNDLDFQLSIFTEPLIGTITEMAIDGFGGIFDGAGFTISNLNLIGDVMAHGLFASIEEEGKIGNLKLLNVHMDSITYDQEIAGYGLVAGVVDNNAIFENITIQNSSIEAPSTAGFLYGAYYLFSEPVGSFQTIVNNVLVENSDLVSTSDFGVDFGGLTGALNAGNHAFYQNHLVDISIQNVNENAGGIVGALRNNATIRLMSNELEFVLLATNLAESQFIGGLIGALEDFNFVSIIDNSLFEIAIVTPASRYVGGMIGVIVSDTYVEIVSNTLLNLDIQALDFVGGMIGGSLEGEDLSINLTVMANEIMSVIIGSSQLGGIVGRLSSAFGMISHNDVSVVMVDGEFEVGGLIGYVEVSELAIWNNVVLLMFDFATELFYDNLFAIGVVGGILGSTGEFNVLQFVNNYVQSSIQIRISINAEAPHNEFSMIVSTMGGLVGYVGPNNHVIVIDNVISFDFDAQTDFSQLGSLVEISRSSTFLGGAFGWALGVVTTLYMESNVIVSSLVFDYVTPAPIVSITHNLIGGVLGAGEGVEVIMKSNRVSHAFDLEFSTANQHLAYTFSSLFMQSNYLGGIAGYLSQSNVSLDQLEMHYEVGLLGSLPLLAEDNIIVISFDSVGGIVGFFEEGYLAIDEFYIQMNVHIDDPLLASLIAFKNANPFIDGLRIYNMASLFGYYAGESMLYGGFIENGLIEFVVDEALMDETNQFDINIFAIAGELQSMSTFFVSSNVYVFANVLENYYGNNYIMELATRVNDENTWFDILQIFIENYPLWIPSSEGIRLILPSLPIPV